MLVFSTLLGIKTAVGTEVEVVDSWIAEIVAVGFTGTPLSSAEVETAAWQATRSKMTPLKQLRARNFLNTNLTMVKA